MGFHSGSGARQKAVLLVEQMTDRMRANQSGMRLGAYDKPAAGSPACLADAAGCTAAQLAQADMGEWLADVSAQLPAGTGIVCIDSTPADGTAAAAACDGRGRVLAVKVWWSDKSAPGGSSRFVTTARPSP